MTILINDVDVSKYVLTDNFNVFYDLNQDITLEKRQFPVVKIPEFDILSTSTIDKTNDNLTIELFDDRGFLIDKGQLTILSSNRSNNQTILEMTPELLTSVNKTPAFFAEIFNQAPTQVLLDLFRNNNIDQYIDQASFNKIDQLFKLNNVTAGLSLNLGDDKTQSIYNYLTEFKTVFLLKIYLKNNKIRFYSDLFLNSELAFELPSKYVLDYNAYFVLDNIKNDWSFDLGNGYALENKDVNNVGTISQNTYGNYKYDITTSLIQLTEPGSVAGGSLKYIAEGLDSLVKLKESPERWIDIKISNHIVEELDLGNVINFLNTNIFISKIARSQFDSTISGFQI